MRRYRGRVTFGCLTLVVGTSLGVIIPYFIGQAIEAVVNHTPIVPLASIVLVLAIIQAFARSIGSITINSASREAEHDLRIDVFRNLVALDGGFYRKHKSGDLVSRLTNDLNTLVQMWGTGIFYVFGIACLLLFSIATMLAIDPILTLWALAPIPLVVVGSQYVSKIIKQRSLVVSQEKGQLSSTVHENLAGVAVIKSYVLEDARREQFRERSTRLMRAAMATSRIALQYGPLSSTFLAVGMVATLWIGGNHVIEGKLQLGTLVQFSTYLSLLGSRIVSLASIVPVFQQGTVAWDRVSALLSQPPKIVDGPEQALATVAGDLELRDLTVEIEGRRLLDGVSLKIPAGTVTVVVGRVGGGKSTFVEAIPRLIDVPSGQVFIDGHDVRELPLGSVRGSIAYAPQQAFLFSATIAENIAFGIDGSPPDVAERVKKAAQIAGLEPDLAALPNGLDTQVGERGITLSGGQRQRVALARAIASDRRIVLLDDSLSAVDTATERRILDGLAEAFRGRTVIMVSHRVTVTTRAHQVAVLDGGKLVEVGTHDELIARGGVYAELYQSQSQAQEEAA